MKRNHIDDARVEAAVAKHIAKQSWASVARITITGTDAEVASPSPP